MNKDAFKNILKEYELKRQKAIKEAQYIKNQVISSSKDLQDINEKIRKLGVQKLKSALMLNKDLSSELENELISLKKQKEDLLGKLGTSPDSFNPNFECIKCEDTGFIFDNNTNTMCVCLRQKLLDNAYNQSNLSNIKSYNLGSIDFSLYSDLPNEKLYASKISPRENIKLIKNIATRFIDNFENPNEKNLMFIGNTGLGKTFISELIANELLKKGKTVLYQTAPILLDTILDYKFGKNNSSYNIYQSIFNVDLLIIDDLGTESLNSIKFAELFTIINTRLLNQNNKTTKTIISTNLSLKNILDTYDERIVSRIVGNYSICKFFGEDIRFKK